jgi:hypothetical protein
MGRPLLFRPLAFNSTGESPRKSPRLTGTPLLVSADHWPKGPAHLLRLPEASCGLCSALSGEDSSYASSREGSAAPTGGRLPGLVAGGGLRPRSCASQRWPSPAWKTRGDTRGESRIKTGHNSSRSITSSRQGGRDGKLRSCGGILPSGEPKKWWTGGELNSRHRDFQSRALACHGA